MISGSDAALNSLNITAALTASGLIYPTSDGNIGEVLVTDGAGNLSFTNNFTASYALTASYAENLTLSGSIANVDYIDFNTDAEVTPTEGRLSWNGSDGTLELGLKYGDVVLQIGQEQHFIVRNATGTTIENGTAVYASGLTGGSGRIEASPFTADGNVREVRFLGLATHDITNGVNGIVTQFGYVRELDTRGTAETSISVGDEDWSEGDILYAHPTVAGKLTNIPPKHKIYVAMVTTRHQTTGVLFVRPFSYGHMDDIHDVLINTGSLSTGDLLVYYDSDNENWINTRTLSGSYTISNGGLTANSFTGSLLGTASYSISTVTSSLALENLIDAQPIVGGIEFTRGNGNTFSINLGGVGSGGSIVTSSFNNVTTTFYNHNFNSRNVLVKVYDNSFNEIIPASLTLTTADKVDITFASPQSGKVVIIKGDGVNSSTGSFSNTVSASFSHTLNSRDLNLGVYDQSFNQIIPATLTIPDSSNVEATFDSDTSGYIVAIARENRISSSYSTTSSISIPNQLGTLNVQVAVYDNEYITLIPENVLIGEDTIKVDLAYTSSGHIVAMGGAVDVSRSTLSTSFRTRIDGASTYNIQHNLDEEWPLVQVYQESTRTQVTPLSIISLDDDTVQINFTGSFTGHVIINS